MKLRLRRKKPSMPDLFDSEFYLSQHDSSENIENAWAHFCKIGFRKGLDPHPLFNTRYYQNAYMGGNFEANPISHYLQSADKFLNPHPLFDARTYLSQIGNPAVETTVLEHFLSHNGDNRASTSVFFDTKKYLFANPEVAPCGFVGLYHYVRYGKVQGRKLFIDQSLIADAFTNPERPDYDCVMGSHQREVRFLASVLGMDSSKPTVVLCANHAATEYASILKKISTELSEVYEVNTVHAFGFNPSDAEQYVPFGPTFCLNWEDAKSDEHSYRLECAASIFEGLEAVGLIYLDSHPSKALDWFSKTPIPIHGVMPSVRKEDFANTVSNFCLNCQTVLVPARVSGCKSELRCPEDRAKVSYFDTDFDAINQSQAGLTAPAQIKAQMGLGRDSVLIVGSGDISFSNGFDRFLSIASSASTEIPNRNIQFLWVGSIVNDDPQSTGLLEELEAAQLGELVLICQDTGLLKDLVCSADILLMTQRNSDSDSQIGDYLESARPIIWFQGNSIVDRLMTDDPCRVAPGNMLQAVGWIKGIIEDSHLNLTLQTANRKRHERATSISDFVYSLSKPLVLKTLEDRAQHPGEDEHRDIIKLPSLTKGARKRRRVIFTAPNWQISGVNTFIETLVNELNKLGFEANVLFTTTQAVAEQKSVLPDMPYQLLSQEPYLRPKRRKELLHNYLAAMAPCVFVPSYDYVASTVTPELPDNVATLGVLHSDDPQHYVHGYRMGPYWDAVVSVSKTIEEKLLALNGSFNNKSNVIRYGIRDEGKSIEMRKPATTEKLRIVYTGRIVQHQKLIFDFVEVARKLNDHCDKFEMVLVGDGPQFTELQQRMSPYVKSGLVELTGRIQPEKISDVLLSSHVFALTSEFEGLPLSMLEALSAGLVPVVTDVESGIGEVCVHNQNALISPIGDPAALADNLIKLANSTELFNRLSLAARETFFEERLTAVDMAEQYAIVLDKLFDGISDAGNQRTDKLIYCPSIERLLNVA